MHIFYIVHTHTWMIILSRRIAYVNFRANANGFKHYFVLFKILWRWSYFFGENLSSQILLWTGFPSNFPLCYHFLRDYVIESYNIAPYSSLNTFLMFGFCYNNSEKLVVTTDMVWRLHFTAKFSFLFLMSASVSLLFSFSLDHTMRWRKLNFTTTLLGIASLFAINIIIFLVHHRNHLVR